MQDLPITAGDIFLTLSAAAAAFAIAHGLVKAGMSYLTLKFGKNTPTQQIEAHTRQMAEQSQQCRFDHEGITRHVAAQNANIAKMLEYLGEQLREMASIRALAERHHDHQMNALQNHKEQLKRIEDLVGRR